jgi:uncharacterized membrane protein YoaK (UPF0700 family)
VDSRSPGAAGLTRGITLAAVLLTVGAGATDVTSFTRLGGVFTSVMTGNLIVFGLAVAQASAGLAEHTALAVGGYVLGVAIGARLIARAPRGRPATAAAAEGWPALVTVALGIELALLAGLSAGWELTGARPGGADQYLLLAVAATAMGVQSAAVRGLGRADFSTTYLTGTLTGLVAGLVTPGKRDWPGLRQAGPLLAVAVGALIGGVLIANAPAALPVIILAPLCLVLATYAWTRRGSRPGG